MARLHCISDDFTNEYKLIAERVVEIQRIMDYSDEDMASMLGVSQEHYKKKLLTGKSPFTPDKLITLRESGFDLFYLFTGKAGEDIPRADTNSFLDLRHRIMVVLAEIPGRERKILVSEFIAALVIALD